MHRIGFDDALFNGTCEHASKQSRRADCCTSAASNNCSATGFCLHICLRRANRQVADEADDIGRCEVFYPTRSKPGNDVSPDTALIDLNGRRLSRAPTFGKINPFSASSG
jgi:hypothetical protein